MIFFPNATQGGDVYIFDSNDRFDVTRSVYRVLCLIGTRSVKLTKFAAVAGGCPLVFGPATYVKPLVALGSLQ